MQPELPITSLVRILTKVSINNSKVDIKGISGRLEMCKSIHVLYQ